MALESRSGGGVCIWLVVEVAALPSWLLLYSVRTPVTGQSRAHTGCTLHVACYSLLELVGRAWGGGVAAQLL